MSAIKKSRNKYYARIFTYNSITKKQEVLMHIPLMTESKSLAKKRQHFVNVNEQLIKDGEIIDIDNFFPWLNERGQSKISKMSLGEGIDRWLESRNVRDKTLESNKWALNHFVNYIPKTMPLASINMQLISDYKKYLSDRLKHSPNSININLRTISTMFNWLVEQEFIEKLPKVRQVPSDESEIKYLAERDIADLLSSNLSYANKHNNGGKYIRDYEHFKRAFSLYLYTGARMSEPFLGEIRGRWLVISPNESKSHKKRIIKLTEEQVIIVEEMRERVGNSEDKENAIRSYSKAFKKVVRTIGLRDDLHLHSLRHTYGCMRRLVTNGNMVQIRDEMGHTKLSTTERYTQIPLDMLEDDFPELSKNLQNNQLGPQTRTPHMFENKKDSR